LFEVVLRLAVAGFSSGLSILFNCFVPHEYSSHHS
jgi:hypothetical protein